jgi:O-acetylserine/cysteine efflux transporter
MKSSEPAAPTLSANLLQTAAAPTPAAFSRTDYLQALVVVVIWGLNFVVMKLGLPGLGPMLLGALRFAAASLPFIFWVRRPQVPWQFVVGYGLVQGVGQFGLLFIGIALGMTAGMASVVMQGQAFFTLLLAAPLLGEHAKRHQWLGLAVASVGLLLLAAAHGEQPGQMTLIGFVLTLGAALMWAVSNLVVRWMGRRAPGYDAKAFIVWTSLVPILPFMGLALLMDGAAVTGQALAGLGWRQVLAVLFLAWLATVLAYTLWTGLLQRHPAGKVAPFSLLVPVVGLLAAYLVFAEQLSTLQWLGTLGVLLGLLLNQFGGRWGAARR